MEEISGLTSVLVDSYMKHKVCIITTVHTVQDARIFHKEALSLVGSGYDVTLIAPHDCDEIIAGIRIVALRKSRGRLRRFSRVFAPLRPALRERADVYHVHDPELLVSLALLRLLTRAKLIYDVHENLPMQIMSKHWIPGYLRRPVAIFSAIFEKVLSSFADGIIAATPTVGQRFPAKKTIVVRNWPKAQELAPLEASYSDRSNSLIYIGGISRVRGSVEMLEAMSLLPSSLKAKLLLCGQFVPAALEEETAGMPGAKRAKYLGWQSRPKLAKVLEKSRIGLVVLHPEENYVDSYPTKLFEYMAAAIPAIASDFPLWRQFVEESNCGILVDPLNPSEIAEAIRRLLENPDEAQKMGENGRRAVLKKYNWEIEADKLLAFYGNLEPQPTNDERAVL